MMPRILFIEDIAEGIEIFSDWLKQMEFILIKVSSGGRTKGILRSGMSDGVGVTMQDHDLDQQSNTSDHLLISATDLITSITISIPVSVPILIHSMNSSKPQILEKRLKSHGVSVTRISIAMLTRTDIDAWLLDVRDNREEMV